TFRGMRIVKSKIKEYITRNRYETLNREELTRFFKPSDFKIFEDSAVVNQQEQKRRTQIIFKTLKFIFEHVYIPILTSFFYITEGYSNYKIFYYPLKTWTYFTNKHFEKFLENFSETSVPQNHMIKPRCIPKENGFRVVVNKSKKDENGKSENLKLSNHHLIISEERKRNYGNSLLDYNEIFSKFLKYDFRNCYMIKFDIKGCFDNIPHAIFEEELKKFFRQEKYHVKKYSSITMKSGRIVTKKHITSLDGSKDSKNFPFGENHCKNEILFDHAFIDIKKKENLIKEIMDFITQNTLIIGKKKFIQMKGLPQGSILSPILCSIFFQYLDKNFFDKYIKKGRLFRYVDDFLIATPDISEIIAIFDNFAQVEQEGISLNFDKTEANFNFQYISSSKMKTDQPVNLDKKQDLTFCGIRISCEGAKLGCDYKRINFMGAFSSDKPGQAMRIKLIRFACKFFKTLYFHLQNIHRYQNIYIFWIQISRRMMSFLRKMPFINKKFVYSVLEMLDTSLMAFFIREHLIFDRNKIKAIKESAFADSGLTFFIEIKSDNKI
ncbi:telomerase catalytic subunit, TERT, partial [Pseudoloma neurophilia]